MSESHLLKEVRELRSELRELRSLLTEPPRRWLDIHQTARYVGISAKSIYNGRTKSAVYNPLPVDPVTRNGRLFWDRLLLDQWMERGPDA